MKEHEERVKQLNEIDALQMVEGGSVRVNKEIRLRRKMALVISNKQQVQKPTKDRLAQ